MTAKLPRIDPKKWSKVTPKWPISDPFWLIFDAYWPRLRSAILAARNVNLPKERIEKAINSALSNKDGDSEKLYEFFFAGVAIIAVSYCSEPGTAESEIKKLCKRHDISISPILGHFDLPLAPKRLNMVKSGGGSNQKKRSEVIWTFMKLHKNIQNPLKMLPGTPTYCTLL